MSNHATEAYKSVVGLNGIVLTKLFSKSCSNYQNVSMCFLFSAYANEASQDLFDANSEGYKANVANKKSAEEARNLMSTDNRAPALPMVAGLLAGDQRLSEGLAKLAGADRKVPQAGRTGRLEARRQAGCKPDVLRK